eukprot:TRINITY_DN83390_c0_g1_i1.p1 TRINITY_DN83390_c0_g1~~TRINITY_DN83390_c0_g1_i1.p1  ORF type:complete len:134 (+),score=35.49 TRINITY_DN83390_c0_g1_i1:28-402(+)
MSSSKVTVDYLKRVQDRILSQLGLGEEEKLDDSVLEVATKMPTKGTRFTVQDIRHPNVSCAGTCWTSLNEWQMCTKQLGEGAPECLQSFRDFQTLCPTEWVNSFREQASEGKYMGVAPIFPEEE